jgi:hypothetical protein
MCFNVLEQKRLYRSCEESNKQKRDLTINVAVKRRGGLKDEHDSRRLRRDSKVRELKTSNR